MNNFNNKNNNDNNIKNLNFKHKSIIKNKCQIIGQKLEKCLIN